MNSAIFRSIGVGLLAAAGVYVATLLAIPVIFAILTRRHGGGVGLDVQPYLKQVSMPFAIAAFFLALGWMLYRTRWQW